jgi:hypothetical protein
MIKISREDEVMEKDKESNPKSVISFSKFLMKCRSEKLWIDGSPSKLKQVIEIFIRIQNRYFVEFL